MKSSTARVESSMPIMTSFKAFSKMEIAPKAESSTATATITKDNSPKDSTTAPASSSATISNRRDYSEMASSHME